MHLPVNDISAFRKVLVVYELYLIIALSHPCFIQGMPPVNHRIMLCGNGIDLAPEGLQEGGFTLFGTSTWSMVLGLEVLRIYVDDHDN